MTRNFNLTDIDSLFLEVRDHESKRLINEAMTAYRGGAFRAAIISTWIAVAYDIFSKGRELKYQGDAAASKFIDEVDSAIENRDISKMQKIESTLLTTANKELLLFAPHEHEAFSRLQSDRHLCAHPAFVVDDEIYRPSPELVRTHISHSLKYLLIHAPLQGKSALDRFQTDILSVSFPTSEIEIDKFIRTRYLDRAKDVLIINLIKWASKAIYGPDRNKFKDKDSQLVIILKIISSIKIEIYEDIMPTFARNQFESMDDPSILHAVKLFNADKRIWDWLSDASQIRIKTLLQSSSIDDLIATKYFHALVIPQLSEAFLEKIDSMDEPGKINIISNNPNRIFSSRAIEVFGKSGGWRSAEARGRSLILTHVQFFTSADIHKVLELSAKNEQIRSASDMPSILESVFDASHHLLPETKVYWSEFIRKMTEYYGDGMGFYTYPNIQEKIAAL